jgi:hypothetical protein
MYLSLVFSLKYAGSSSKHGEELWLSSVCVCAMAAG